ncbi:hypothetical protein M0812_20096 [Anaeramoeba flamelloides]|uniref:Uncharacterized protein n=1 Tax=Anaeramoeba flamelloides TaxID=1746091 RepID=A0AAV7YW01_9EUKA|nr:hypothetical protein M0812_20096 [Anaeramoeba flamelloides]
MNLDKDPDSNSPLVKSKIGTTLCDGGSKSRGDSTHIEDTKVNNEIVPVKSQSSNDQENQSELKNKHNNNISTVSTVSKKSKKNETKNETKNQTINKTKTDKEKEKEKYNRLFNNNQIMAGKNKKETREKPENLKEKKLGESETNSKKFGKKENNSENKYPNTNIEQREFSEIESDNNLTRDQTQIHSNMLSGGKFDLDFDEIEVEPIPNSIDEIETKLRQKLSLKKERIVFDQEKGQIKCLSMNDKNQNQCTKCAIKNHYFCEICLEKHKSNKRISKNIKKLINKFIELSIKDNSIINQKNERKLQDHQWTLKGAP